MSRELFHPTKYPFHSAKWLGVRFFAARQVTRLEVELEVHAHVSVSVPGRKILAVAEIFARLGGLMTAVWCRVNGGEVCPESLISQSALGKVAYLLFWPDAPSTACLIKASSFRRETISGMQTRQDCYCYLGSG